MRAVMNVGAVPSGTSGVSDYGRLLSEELRRGGVKVDERWIVNSGLRVRDAGAAAVELLALARAIPRDSVVLWHYSSFSYTLRGIPLPGVLLGLVLRNRGVVVVTLLHELAYTFGRRGWRGWTQALTQQLVFPFVLAGSDVAVVTTSRRARALERIPRPFHRPVRCVPVFSTLGDGRSAAPTARGTGPAIIGVPSWTSDGVRPEVLIEALVMLDTPASSRLLLLGASEATSDEGRQWMNIATRAGLGDRIDFSGVAAAGELSRRLASCDLIVFANSEGPSSRKTTLAAALAHGMPVVALDGPERWQELVRARAVEVVAPEPTALSAVIGRLLTEPQQRQELASRGRAFYEENMTLAAVAGALETILAAAPTGRIRRP